MAYGGRGIAGGTWGSMLLWGANAYAGHAEHSFLGETNLEIGERNAVFGRAEYVRKSAEDLVLPGYAPNGDFDINSLVLGYVREVASIRGGSMGVGGRASVNFVLRNLEPFYGTRTPSGIDVYVRVRPKKMAASPMGGMTMPMDMPGMKMSPPAR